MYEDFQLYNIATVPATVSGPVIVPPLCNGWQVINTGTSIATVNGQVLHPGTPGTNVGEGLAVSGNYREIFKGKINVSFATGGGGTNELTFIFKLYPENK